MYMANQLNLTSFFYESLISVLDKGILIIITSISLLQNLLKFVSLK